MSDNHQFEKSLFPSLNLGDPFEDEPSLGFDAFAPNAAPTVQSEGSSSWLVPNHGSSMFDFDCLAFTPDALDIGLFEGGKEGSGDVAEKSHATTKSPTSSTSSETRIPLPFSSANPVEDSYWCNRDITSRSRSSSPLPSLEAEHSDTASPRGVSAPSFNPSVSNVHREANLSPTALPVTEVPSDNALPRGEDEFDRLSPPALSEASNTTRDSSPAGPLTPSDEQRNEPQEAARGVSSDANAVSAHNAAPSSTLEPLTSIPEPVASTPVSPVQGASPPEHEDPEASMLPTPAILPSVAEVSSQKKRKRSTKFSIEQLNRSQRERNIVKPFTITTRCSAQPGSTSAITLNAVSCCEMVGDKGYCPFKVNRDGIDVICNQELPKVDRILRKHFSIHLEELGYYERESTEGNFPAYCPFCDDMPTQFDGLLRHILCTELQANTAKCECGGTISRTNQPNNVRRHERSGLHRAYEEKKGKEKATREEKEAQGSGAGEANGKTVEEKEEKVTVVTKEETREEFVQGSSRDGKRRRLSR